MTSLVVIAVMLLSLTGASASTLTVKILHPRADPCETPSNRFVTFAAAAFDSEEQDVSAKSVFTWDFGDGTSAEQNPISHLYEPGKYQVTVTATLEDACGEASMTVIVGEPAPLPEATLRAGGPLILRLPEEMPAGKACDQPVIACVEALPVGDATYCNFYYKPASEQQFSGHSGGPAWNVTWGAYKLFGMADWHSCVDQNYQAGDCAWAAELYVWWEEDPIWVGPEGWGLDNTIVKAEDDCGEPYSGVLAYDPQGDAPTISWTLSHLAFHTTQDDDPPFNVRVKIYKLDGTLVFTYDMADERLSSYVNELTWKGWQGAYDDWENTLPETAGNAPKGIYAYRVWAVHDLEGIWPTGFDYIEVGPGHDCKYSDKSYKVLGTVNTFYYFDKDVQAGTLKGVVKYTLNRRAGSVDIGFFGPDLEELGSLSGQPVDAGTSCSGVYTLTGVSFDQNEDPIGPIACVLYVKETPDDGEANRDCEAMMALHRGSTNLQPVYVGLREVSFSGDHYHEVQLDDNSGPYGAAHWTDNSTPPDGDADDPGEREYPVCFVRDTVMEVSVKVELNVEWQPYGDVYLRGDGPGGMDFYTEDVSVNGTVATAGPIECSAALPNMVNRYAPMPVAWEASVDGGQSWHYVGTSVNECFVTLATPQCSPRFRTVLYLATKQTGATTEERCVTNTWASFSTGNGPANVKAWDETAGDYVRPLHYYANHLGDSVYTTAGLLAGGNGQCHAWAELFKECLRAHDVSNVMRTRVLPPSGYEEFAVREVGFDDIAPRYPTAPIWKYGINAWDVDGRETDDLDITVAGIAGQNTDPPYAKLFGQHFIVHVTGATTYYDPSYGLTSAGASDYTDAAIGGWADDVANERLWCRESAVQQQLQFGDESW